MNIYKFRSNFDSNSQGIFILGEKKVYWSTTKVASHIRSGHCEGATTEEVELFKKEFVYDSPKSLVHKSAIKKRIKEVFDVDEEYSKPRKRTRLSPKQLEKPKPETSDSETADNANQFHPLGDEEETLIYEEIASGPGNYDGEEKVEIVFLSEEGKLMQSNKQQQEPPSIQMSREEKFIHAVYPQFKGKTKLNLIDEILDLKRQNDLLSSKAKRFENTINRLLN